MNLIKQTQTQEPCRRRERSKKAKIVLTAGFLSDVAEKLGINPKEDYNLEIIDDAKAFLGKNLPLLKRNNLRTLKRAAEVRGRSKAVTYSPFYVSTMANFMNYAFAKTGDIPGTIDPLAFAEPGSLTDFENICLEMGSFSFFSDFKTKGNWEKILENLPYLEELTTKAQKLRNMAHSLGRDILQSDRIFQVYLGRDYLGQDGDLYVPLRAKEFGRTLKLQNLVNDARVREALLKEELPVNRETVDMIKNLTYLAKEAERYQEVRYVAKGMKNVYDSYTKILETMRGKKERN